MYYLLDKVTARLIVQAILKRSQHKTLTPEEGSAIDFFWRTTAPEIRLFIVPATANILQRLLLFPENSAAIHRFLSRVEVAQPISYYKRWARRLRDYGFTREDAAVLAFATFATDQDLSFLSMNLVVTQDQPMINNWLVRQTEIQKHLDAMRYNIPSPYCYASLPQVLRPEQVRT